jgi:hypothetical protein
MMNDDLEGSILGLVKMLAQHLPGGTGKKHENSQTSRCPWARVEPSISQIRVEVISTLWDVVDQL